MAVGLIHWRLADGTDVRRPGRSLRHARLVVAVKDLGVEVETFGDRCAPLRVRVEEGLGLFYA